MSQRKLLVIGNCQARPLSKMLESTGYFDCLEPIILHLAKSSQYKEHLAQIEAADIVLAQNTADNFAVTHLRSKVYAKATPVP